MCGAKPHTPVQTVAFPVEQRTSATQADISDAEKRQRMERLLTLQREIATKNYKRFLGRTMRVLVEGDSKRGDGWLFGKSNEAIIVEFMGDRSLIGTFVSVQITESKNWAVSGRLLDDERKEAVQK